MANPVINSITGAPTAPVAPGTPVDLVVVASDSDTRDVTLTFTVTDAEGHSSPPMSVATTIVDNLTCVGSVVSGGGTLTQTGPFTFRYVP